MNLFIFRRDLRIEDNTALNAAKDVLACFIFDPRQVGKQPYYGIHAVQFMLDSLADLSSAIKNKGGKLHFFNGLPHDVVERLLKEEKIDGVFVNKDYTPFSKARDEAIAAVCKQHNIPFQSFDDALLHAPGSVLKDDGTPYTVFTPFHRKATGHDIAEPKTKKIVFRKKKLSWESEMLTVERNERVQKGGRKEALKILKHVQDFSNYDNVRNLPAADATTHLAPHNKFGTVSVREVCYAITKAHGPFHTLLTELHWRDFFTHIAHHFPHVFTGAFNKKYNSIKWENDKKKFQAWCEGKTGFPIVDAGMRELNETGFMHNRVRMIVASFLVKDLLIDWRWGEKYFAQKLTDYDPAVNNGNWQWAASTGCDAQPYFRIFNPWRQQKRFDEQCDYIKKWVSELRSAEATEIHRQSTQHVRHYSAPIVEHAVAAARTKALFREAAILGASHTTHQ